MTTNIANSKFVGKRNNFKIPNIVNKYSNKTSTDSHGLPMSEKQREQAVHTVQLHLALSPPEDSAPAGSASPEVFAASV